MAIRFTVAAAVVTFAVIGCASEKPAEPVNSADQWATVQASKALITPGAVSTATMPPASKPPQDVADLLFSLQDMPSGWTVTPPGTDDSDSTQICDVQDPVSTVTRGSSGEVGFSQSEFGPFLSQAVGVYQFDDAERVMDNISAILKGCVSWTEFNDDGDPVVWRLSQLSFPKFGDETVAARISTSDVPLFGTAQVDLVFFRIGTVVEVIGYVAVGPSAALPSPLEVLVERAAAKVSSGPR